jgi:hypothetical protein
MRISESRIRQIIREEARRMMNEGGSRMSIGELIRSLKRVGEDRLADRFKRQVDMGRSNDMVRFRGFGSDVQMYWMSPDGSSQYFDDIPMNVARNIGVDF